jgi:hypothetical protein
MRRFSATFPCDVCRPGEPVYLTALAEQFADLSGLAATCVECFCGARCAGCDVKAITPVAKAAVTLGATLKALAADMPPHRSETAYLDGVDEIRVAIRLRGQQNAELADQAVDQAELAARAMRAALKARPPDYAAYQMALRQYQDAVAAYDICVETDDRLRRAYEQLATARPVFGETYEGTERFVAKGGVMPYEGRWVTGELPRPTVRRVS